MITKKIRKCIIGCFIALVCVNLNFGTAQAATLTNSTSQKQLFAVAGGGWSSISVQVIYNENYTKSGSNNKFTGRSKCVFYTRAYATSCPTVSLLSVKHSNGKSFTSWEKGSVYVDTSLWESGSYYSNSTSVTYINTTSVTGNLPFMLACDGGTPSFASGSVSLSLNTK